MAYLQFKSSNDKFSHALRKNPANPLLVTELREGHLFGYYSDPQTFNIVFKDADKDISFDGPDGEFAYLDSSRYSSPLFILGACREYFNHLTNSNVIEEDVEADQVVTLGLVSISRKRWLEEFIKHFKDFTIEVDEKCANYYQLTISSHTTIRRMLMLIQLLVMFVCITTKTIQIDRTESLIERYLRIINELNAPYFIRYMFKMFFFYSKNIYNKYIDELAKDTMIEFTPGNTHDARIRFVMDNLTYSGDILDLGCGEGRYFHLSSKLTGIHVYYAVDTDGDILNHAQRRKERKEYEAVEIIHGSFDDITLPNSTEVILSEVLEHMPKEEAGKLLQKLVNDPNVSRILITTPNKAFNQYYELLDDESRHEDHKWECTRNEFIQFVIKYANHDKDKTLNFVDIGDKVDGEPVTHGCIITL